MLIDRRRALGLGLSVVSPGVGMAKTAPPCRFDHGVASGDPLVDRVVLWTRVTPQPPHAGEIQVDWEMAEEPSFKTPVARGAAATGPGRDYTVKVDVAGLKPGRDYLYRFKVGTRHSPVGQTRTLPAGRLDQAVLAFVTCSLYPSGLFNVYDHIARLARVDAVIHLGDYIYEYGGAEGDYGMEVGRRIGRIPEPGHELVTLADYRTRHALYKRDPDLQAAHARAPWICVWDDHEISNDCWVGGAENHQPKTEGEWVEREAAALRAYYEWMPLREPAPGRAFEAINRSFQFGDLASLVMVESRLMARSRQLEYGRPGDVPMTVYSSSNPSVRQQVADPGVLSKVLVAAAKGETPPPPYVVGPDRAALQAMLANPERQMLGARQEQWLANELAASVKAGKPWQVLGNQVVMARTKGPDLRQALGADELARVIAALPADRQAYPAKLAELFTYDVPYDLDGWDGYPAARERVYDAIKASQGNVIVVSGDSHAFWVNELRDAAGALVAAEFGTSSVTSPSLGDELPGPDIGAVFVAQSPEVKFCDQSAKGYVLLTLTRDAAVADLVQVETLAKPYAARNLARFRVKPAPGPGIGAPERI